MPELARLKSILASPPRGKLGMLHRPKGRWTESSEEMIQHLLEVHFPECRLEDRQLAPAPSQQRAKWIPSRDWRVAKHTVTEDRIRWAIGTMNPYKSPGEDGIFPALLQKGMQYYYYAAFNTPCVSQQDKSQAICACTPLCRIYRACIANNYILQVWKHARVLFLPKPGKMDYTTAKAFRPISLTCFLLKGLEKVIDRYLREGPLVDLPLQPRQHRYQAGKLTESALH